MPSEIKDKLGITGETFLITGKKSFDMLVEKDPLIKQEMDDNNTSICDYIRRIFCWCYKASYIEAVESPVPFENVYKIDVNSAYPHIANTTPLPVRYLRREKGITFPKDGEIAVWERLSGLYSLEPDYDIVATHIYEARVIGNGFFRELFDYTIKYPEHKKTIKKIMNSSLGYIHKDSRSIAVFYLWRMQYNRMKEVRKALEKNGAKFLYAHTDGIIFQKPGVSIIGTFLNKCGIKIGRGLGEWKVELDNGTAMIMGPAKYHVKGERPVLAGYNWNIEKDNSVIEVNGIKYDPKEAFPLFKPGDMVTCLEKENKILKRI